MPYTPPDSPDTNDTARQWRFWSSMALLPILAWLACLWLFMPPGSVLGFLLIATPLWIGGCAVKLTVLNGTRGTGLVLAQAFLYFVLFLIVDTLLLGAVVWGSCMLAR